MSNINVVMAREAIPPGPSVFLAGPTPECGASVPSWRPAAAQALADSWLSEVPLTVLTPESRGGVRAARYEDQVKWEMRARASATVVLFWVPRCVNLMPGFTTNVEFGFDIGMGRRVVLGAPADCPSPERNRYLIYLAELAGAPVCRTLDDTAVAAVRLVADTG